MFMLCQAGSIDSGDERDLERKTRPANPCGNFRAVPTVQVNVNVGRKNGDQKSVERPPRRTSNSREEKGGSAKHLRSPADDVHGGRKRDVSRNHRQIRLRMHKMVKARADEKRREQVS